MSLALDISPQEISKYLSEQILKSTIGEIIKKAIDSKLAEGYSLQRDIEKYVEQSVRSIISETISNQFNEKIKALVLERLTQERLQTLADSATEKILASIDKIINDSRYC